MAVPKKRTSRSKTNSRFANWLNKSNLQAQRAISKAKSITNKKNTVNDETIETE
ncbi:ribosomal protein L32 (chloroplast) [Guillardia theta]|uniref:Large ribosomal subunit protein bL32c n=2 Tax=Guillardia theta TaxID=55529 RepID=RK32_GUITH|nr:ribosomal protein L32 [Guillardia theta]O78434.3 RecName: Full=Large ribosomal subunit protein bL32c; AltName: Full=50S ribosomal protein L32, chloroplastic [Guillardia theta]AAC35619.1 ribosomal protein L32 [Guillardia theta]